MRPKLKRDQLKDKTVFAGQTLRASVEVTGEPAPVISWWSPIGAKLENDDRTKVEQDGCSSNMSLSGITMKECGSFKVTKLLAFKRHFLIQLNIAGKSKEL